MTTELYDLIADDYSIFDGRETVTFTTAAGVSDTSVTAIRTMANLRAAAGGVGSAGVAFSEEFGVDGNAAVFVLYSETMTAGLVPSGGDKITDADGDVWTVGVATPLGTKARWKCVCTKDRE